MTKFGARGKALWVLGLAAFAVVSSQAQIALDREPLGPCSRKTSLVISEIMYHPRPVPGLTNRLQFIEIYNANPWDENLSGYFLDGSVYYEFPSNTMLAAKAFLVVARDPDYLTTNYAITNVVGPWDNAETVGLSIDSDTVRLRNNLGAVLLQIEYSDAPPWPASADGSGHSMVLARPSYGENDARAWAQSDVIGGSPGRDDPVTDDPLSPVVLNEWMAHTDTPLRDSIELYNHSDRDIDLSGAWLSDSPDTNRYRIPDGVMLFSGDFLSFDDAMMGFSLFAEGETIFLVNSNQTRVIDAINFKGMSNGVSAGRFPDGGPLHYSLASRTFGAPNSPPKRWAVVVNEIMYNPISGDVNEEYVELYNRASSAINIGAWAFTNGVRYEFPANSVMPAGAYWVVAKNPAYLQSIYTNLNAQNTFGPYDGTLANGGERLTFSAADYDVVTINGQRVELKLNVIASEVVYQDGGRWGHWSDGGGASLELIDPEADTYLPSNWAESDDTGESPWTAIEYAGPLGETLGPIVNDSLIIAEEGIGECLVDEVEVRVDNGPNLVANGGFESGLDNWTCQGSHDFSTVENQGFAGARSLHVRAGSRGDNQSNRILSAPFSSPIPTNATTVSIRAKVKWLRGHPEVLLRLHGGGAEAYGALGLPKKLGTPGAPNSRRIANAGPAIYQVKHTPILPAPGAGVVVSACVVDPQGVGPVTLRYRVDPSPDYLDIPMRDEGLDGDEMIHDGVYSATIPGQPEGGLVTFYVEARDTQNAMGTFPEDVFPAAGFDRCWPYDAVTRECVVRWGEAQMPGDFPTYHLWISRVNSNRWHTRHPLNNTELDGTFVYNNCRVIYNALPLYSGSPWHRTNSMSGPAGPTRVDYEMNFSDDEPLFGATDFILANPGNPEIDIITDLSALSEQTAYRVLRGMGMIENHRRYVHYFLNGSQRSTTPQRPGNFIFEDVQQPNGDMIEQWFPDNAGGQLFKVEDWFEFAPNGFDILANNDADLQRRTLLVNGQPTFVPATYRFMFRKRSIGIGNSANDYAEIYALVDAVSPPDDPDSATMDPDRLATIMDWEQWMRIFAVQRAVGNWDSFGWARGKNDYLYKLPGGPFEHMTWDIDYCMGLGRPADEPLFESNDSRVRAMFNTPAIVRAYWRAFEDLVNGPFNNETLDPFIDERADALLANNVNIDPAAVERIKTYIGARRAFLQAQLASVAAPFSVALPASFTTNDNLLAISGSAPVAVKEVRLNGTPYPYRWISVTNFELRVVLNPGINDFVLQGFDRFGNEIAGVSQALSVVYDGPVVDPAGALVISEIMYEPAVAGAQFVEIMNLAQFNFDLSGWQLEGADFTFPPGSIMTNGQIVVVARDWQAFRSVHGSIPVAGEFDQSLLLAGTRLLLVKANATNDDRIVIDGVCYEFGGPWPRATNGLSLQLIDPAQDNRRSANWGVDPVALATPGAPNSIATMLPPFDPLWLNELHVAGLDGRPDNVGEVEPWLEIYNSGTDPLSLDDYYLANNFGTNLVQWPFPLDTFILPGEYRLIWLDGEPEETDGTDLHAGFRVDYRGTLALVRLIDGQPQIADHLEWRMPYPNVSHGCFPDGDPLFRGTLHEPTPAAPNVRRPVAVMVNEWMTSNTKTLADPADNRFDDWFELHNGESFAVDLGGCYLSDDPFNPMKYPVPDNGRYRIPPGGYLLVWADGQPNQNRADRADLHANFALGSTVGIICLYARDGTTLVDRVVYYGQTPDVSEGRYADGATNIFYLNNPTPRRANSALPDINSRPLFPPPTNYIVFPNSTNTFNVRASDPDSPPQRGTFSIDSAPPVSLINQAGYYRWIVPADQPYGDYPVTLRITDNGTPPLSDTMTFLITVRPRSIANPVPQSTIPEPSLYQISAAGGPFTFTIESLPGHTYRVLFTDDLSVPDWQPLAPDFVAANRLASFTDLLVAPRRFYRVLQTD